MTQFINTTALAIKEAKAIVRSANRRGDVMDFTYAAKARRFDAGLVLESARMWRAKGEIATAIRCYKVARAHLTIARYFDKLA